MLGKAFVIAKTNLRNIKVACTTTYILMGVILLQDIVMLILDVLGIYSNPAGNLTVSYGNYLFLLIILGAIYISTTNFRMMMNLGAKRKDYFYGCYLTYVIMAAIISFLSILLYFTYDRFAINLFLRGGTMDVLYWFGWLNNGVIVAYFRQFAFLLLLSVLIHTLSTIQDRWYGWITDGVIIAVISVFTPIAPLRQFLIGFFNLIIFNNNALLQIFVCLILSIVIYLLNKPILAAKAI